MEKTQPSRSTVRSWIFYLLSYTLFIAAAIIAAYIPAMQAVPDHLYSTFVWGRIFVAFLGGMMFSVLFTGVTWLAMKAIYRHETKKVPLIWAYVPYILLIALYGWVCIDVHINPVSEMPKRENLPYWVPESDPIIDALSLQLDLVNFFGMVSIGFVFLLVFKPFRFYFLSIVTNDLYEPNTVRPISERVPLTIESDQDGIKDDGDFVNTAEELANTFARSETAEDLPPVEVNFVAFVYGEGFDYTILDVGYAVPFLFDDENTVESLHGGIYLHINTALYIRFDHIVLIDLNKQCVWISPELVATFDRITRQSVREKIASYRYKPTLDNCFKIRRDLVSKLEKKLNQI